MQQNILLYSEAKTARPFWWSSLDFWVVWAFSRLTTSEDWPFWPLRGLKGQISGLSASLRPGQPRNLARQPKKSCCFSSLYNKIPLPHIRYKLLSKKKFWKNDGPVAFLARPLKTAEITARPVWGWKWAKFKNFFFLKALPLYGLLMAKSQFFSQTYHLRARARYA